MTQIVKKYIDENKRRWNELADVHFKSEYYNVDEFRRGGISLSQLEVQEVSNVKGKKLLHLQCHFGKDTLSWARLGAEVTGVDFSPRAIELARQLSNELGLKATFIQSDIMELPTIDNSLLVPHSFDIVFTSHGSIYWLPDLKKWAEVISLYLKRGGVFYIVDSHPTAFMFDDEDPKGLKLRYPYFHQKEPIKSIVDGSYASGDPAIKSNIEYGWPHNLSYIVNNLIQNDLEILFINEYSIASWKMYPFLKPLENGWWYLPVDFPQIPLTFSIKAKKKDT